MSGATPHPPGIDPAVLSVILEPMDVMDVGRMAVFADPQGGMFNIMQNPPSAG